MKSNGSSKRGKGLARRTFEINLAPLRFLKALVAVSFLTFSYFTPHDGTMDERSDTLEMQRYSFLNVIKYWGAHTVQVASLITGYESTMQFIKLKDKVTKDDQSSSQAFLLKYGWGCMLYCAQWLLVVVLSSYIGGLVEIVYDKNDAKGIENHSDDESNSPVLVTAISRIVQSVLLVAFLVPLLVPSVKRVPALKPWVALLLTAAAIQLSDTLGPQAHSTALSLSCITDSFDESKYHSNELSCALKDRSVAILMGAICAIFVFREGNSQHHKRHVNVAELNRNIRTSDSNERFEHPESNISGQLKSSLLVILSLLYLFSSPVTIKALLSLEIVGHNAYIREVLKFVENFIYLSSWAYLMVTMMIKPDHNLGNSWLRALSSNSVWDSFSRFLYPLIFILRYRVLEHIVKNRFGFFSINQFLIFIFCVYLVGNSKKEDEGREAQSQS